jgi:hypothetical protein
MVELMHAFGNIEYGVHGTVVRGGEIAVGNFDYTFTIDRTLLGLFNMSLVLTSPSLSCPGEESSDGTFR